MCAAEMWLKYKDRLLTLQRLRSSNYKLLPWTLKSSIVKGTEGSNVRGMTDLSGHRLQSWQVKWLR